MEEIYRRDILSMINVGITSKIGLLGPPFCYGGVVDHKIRPFTNCVTVGY